MYRCRCCLYRTGGILSRGVGQTPKYFIWQCLRLRVLAHARARLRDEAAFGNAAFVLRALEGAKGLAGDGSQTWWG